MKTKISMSKIEDLKQHILNNSATWPGVEDEVRKALEDLEYEIIQRVKNCMPENPYPETIFPTTTDEYVEIIPDPKLRTAISGVVGRMVYNGIKKTFEERIEFELKGTKNHA